MSDEEREFWASVCAALESAGAAHPRDRDRIVAYAERPSAFGGVVIGDEGGVELYVTRRGDAAPGVQATSSLPEYRSTVTAANDALAEVISTWPVGGRPSPPQLITFTERGEPRAPASPALAAFFRHAAAVAAENADVVHVSALLQVGLDGAAEVVRLGTLPSVTAEEEQQARAMIERAFVGVGVTSHDVVVGLLSLAAEAERGAVKG
jgi:hypothetical protein